jgi:hypothetical protein
VPLWLFGLCVLAALANAVRAGLKHKRNCSQQAYTDEHARAEAKVRALTAVVKGRKGSAEAAAADYKRESYYYGQLGMIKLLVERIRMIPERRRLKQQQQQEAEQQQREREQRLQQRREREQQQQREEEKRLEMIDYERFARKAEARAKPLIKSMYLC